MSQKFGRVLFNDLPLRRLAENQYTTFTEGVGKYDVPILSRLWA